MIDIELTFRLRTEASRHHVRLGGISIHRVLAQFFETAVLLPFRKDGSISPVLRCESHQAYMGPAQAMPVVRSCESCLRGSNGQSTLASHIMANGWGRYSALTKGK